MEWLLRVEQPSEARQGDRLLAELLHGHVRRVLVPVLLASGCQVRVQPVNELTVEVYVQAPAVERSPAMESDNGAACSETSLHGDAASTLRIGERDVPGFHRAR